jgi:hypothetical protein
MSQPSPNPSQGEVPKDAVLAVFQDLYNRQPDYYCSGEMHKGDERLCDDIREQLAPALPAIRSQIDQEWEERLEECREAFAEQGCNTCEEKREKAEERLKEVERQLDQARAHVQEQRVAKVQAEAALSQRDEQVRAEVERRLAKQRKIDPQTPFIRGTRAALLALLKYLNRLRDSSTSPQQEVEERTRTLEVALRFYADHRNYEDGDNEEIPGFGEADVNDDMIWTADAGYTARVALGIQESDKYNAFAEKRIPAEVRDAIQAVLTQPPADPEVPRCGLEQVRERLTELREQERKKGANTDSKKAEMWHATRLALLDDILDFALFRADCQSTPELLGEEAKRFVSELRKTAEKWQRERAKTRQAEKDDHASGKLEAGHTYEATWNYYEGLAKAYEFAARDAEEFFATQPVSESPGDSGELPVFEKPGGGLTLLGLYRSSLGWAIDFIGGCGDEPDGGPEDNDWIEYAAAKDLLKDDPRLFDQTVGQPVPGNSGGVEEGRPEPVSADEVCGILRGYKTDEDELRDALEAAQCLIRREQERKDERDTQIAEALYWLDGGDAEAAEAALKDLERVPPPASTQPPSPQAEVQEGSDNG